MFCCTRCLTEKPVSDFQRQTRGKRGHSAQCKDCLKQYHREYVARFDPVSGKHSCSICQNHLVYGENWIKSKAQQMQMICSACYNVLQKKDRRTRPENWLYYNAKARAKKEGLPFDIAADDINIPEFCPVIGIRLVIGDGSIRKQSPTLDRIIPSKGYVKGNIAVISMKANRLKNDGSLEEFRRIVAWMEAKLNGE